MKKIQEGKVPQWLQKRLFKAYGAMYDEYDKKEYSSNELLHMILTKAFGECLDHWGYNKKTMDFIICPYDCSFKNIKNLLKTCDTLDVEAHIRGWNSWDNDTFAIVIRPKHQIDDKE